MERLVSTDQVVDDVLEPYRSQQRSRPNRCWVMANMVAGLDGTAAKNGEVRSMSTPLDFELFIRLRSLADIVLVGAETVRRERYGPVRLPADAAEQRHLAGRANPRIAIVSRSLRLDPQLPVFQAPDERPLVLTCSSSAHLVDGVERYADVIVAGAEHVDLRLAVSRLFELGARVVLSEGGPTLLGDLVAADLLDEYCLTLSPVVGGDPLPVINTNSITTLRNFELAHVLEHDSTLFLRYLSKDKA